MLQYKHSFIWTYKLELCDFCADFNLFIFQVLQSLYYGGQQLVLGQRLFSIAVSCSLSLISLVPVFAVWRCLWWKFRNMGFGF